MTIIFLKWIVPSTWTLLLLPVICTPPMSDLKSRPRQETVHYIVMIPLNDVIMQILQLVLQEEISPDASSVKRSQVTGNLLLTLCKAGKLLVPSCLPKKGGANKKTNMPAEERGLKVNSNGTTDEHRSPKINCGHKPQPLQSTLKRNSSVTVFQDDPTVPPLI